MSQSRTSFLCEACDITYQVGMVKADIVKAEDDGEPQKEKYIRNSLGAAANMRNNEDILEFNARGRIISALQSTLTLAPNTMFTNMFSGRWEDSVKRDSNGRIFIDEDSELIEIIVNFLRMKKREDPFHPIEAPVVPDIKKKYFVGQRNTVL